MTSSLKHFIIKGLWMFSAMFLGFFWWAAHCRGAVVSTVAVKQEGGGFDSWFLCKVCVFFLCLRWFSPANPASYHSPKNMQTGVRWIGHSNLRHRCESLEYSLSLYVREKLWTGNFSRMYPTFAKWCWDRRIVFSILNEIQSKHPIFFL